MAILTAAACNSPTEPAEGQNPAGSAVCWFNGLGSTVDLYYPGADSLVSNAYINGDAPNDMAFLGQDRLAVLSSLSSQLQIFDVSTSGTTVADIQLPQGSNPWAITYYQGKVWISLLLTGRVMAVSAQDWSVTDTVSVSSFPYGIAAASGKIFVSHGDYYPDTTSGGVTVLDSETLEYEGWIDTGRNTTELWYCSETGNIHAFSTTYTGDGKISVIDPITATVTGVINTGGNPMSPVVIEDRIACCDGWGSKIFFYNESGLLNTWTPDSSLSLAGLAASGDTLYMTDFSGDRVRRALYPSLTMLPDLTAGDGPQGIMSLSVE